MSKELIDGMLAAMGNGIVSHLTQLSGGKSVGVVLHVLHDDGQFSCTHNLPDEDYHGFMAAVVESNALDASAALDAQRAEALGEAAPMGSNEWREGVTLITEGSMAGMWRACVRYGESEIFAGIWATEAEAQAAYNKATADYVAYDKGFGKGPAS